jgi:ribosomal protein S18 acetylase RimI-like enzyme
MKQAEIVEVDWENPTHGRDLVSLLDEYAREPSGGGDGLSTSTKENLFRALSERGNCHAILLYEGKDSRANERVISEKSPYVEGDVAVGLLISFVGFSTFACKPLLNLHDIVVSRHYRGKGYSKRLLQHAEVIAQRLGCCKLTLEVLSKNEVAIRTYESFGFENYQLDSAFGHAVFLQKKLTT